MMLSWSYGFHMVTMALIAILIHQICDLSSKLEDATAALKYKASQPGKLYAVKPEARPPRHDPPRRNTDNTVSGDIRHKQLGIQSSVWCRGRDRHLCKFSNLCYHGDADEFVMFQDHDSVYENVDLSGGIFTLDLSSLSDHNVYQTTIINIPSVYSYQFNISWVNETTVIFKPFLSGNLMHVFHDDILPLHHSVRLISPSFNRNSKKRPDIQLFSLEDLTDCDTLELYNMTDCDTLELYNMTDCDTLELYNMFSNLTMKYKLDFTLHGGLTCFKEAYVGLSRTTVWYDYGFTRPQGPVDNIKVTGSHIHSAVNYIWNQLKLDSTVHEHYGDYVVLISRKENRRILNEMVLTLDIAKTLGVKVISINLETQSLSEVIVTVKKSKGLIGMHGSMMILGLFLKPGSIMVELFPYAINPVNYTPYKTLTELPGMNIVYESWANQNVQNSVGHPDWPSDVGGLNHLEPDQREIIMTQTEVPQHLCCSDPSWLYHIYQDTIVDVDEVTSLVKKAVEKSKNVKDSKPNSGIMLIPSKVKNVTCSLSDLSETLTNGKSRMFSLYLQWAVPWTNSLLSQEKVHYEILIQDSNDATKPVGVHKSSSTHLALNVDSFGIYIVWVKCVLNEVYGGPYSDAVPCQDEM